MSLAVAALLTPLILRLALKHELYDVPDERKVHTRPIPRLGGIAIVTGFFVPVTGLLLVDAGLSVQLSENTSHIIGLFVGGLAIAALGIFDDLKGANAIQKLIVQVGVAVAMFMLDYRIEKISNPLGGGAIELGFFSLPVTVAWFVGVVNAVNLIDGLDGLAGGVGLICVSTLFSLGLMDNNALMALFCACLAGSLVGFLFFNFNPARIFMGDTGSLFLGFVLAAFSISTSSKGTTTVALAIPVLALGLPIIDTFLAVGRRVREQRPIFSADKEHIHHKLLRAGLSHRQAVLVLYGVAAAFGIAAILLRISSNAVSGLVLLVVVVLLFALFRLISARGGRGVVHIGDPFDSGTMSRTDVHALAGEIANVTVATELDPLLTKLSDASGVLAVTVRRDDTDTLFVWSRELTTAQAMKPMVSSLIPLNARGVLALQFTTHPSRSELATVIPWELIAQPLADAMDRTGWEPVQHALPASPASLRSFLTLPGLVFLEVDEGT